MARAAEGEFEAVMNQALAACARAGAGFIEQDHGSFLEQAGADAAEHIVRRLPLQDDVVDAVGVEQLSEQQPRRPRTNDGDLCPQTLLPWSNVI